MANRFGGFTPRQQQALLAKMGYEGPAQQDDINKFMLASPRAAAKMGKYATLARSVLEGGMAKGFAEGGLADGISTWSGGQANGYSYGGKKYLTLGEAQAAQQANTFVRAGEDSVYPASQQAITTEVITQPSAEEAQPVEDVITKPAEEAQPVAYDPTTGLPTAVDTPDYTEIAKGSMQGVNANDSSWATKKTAELVANDAIRNNPNDYTLRKDGKYFTIVYGDGTEVATGYRYQNQAEGRAQALVKGLSAAAPYYSETKTAQDIYEEQLGQYKEYQTGQAQQATADPQATLNQAQQNLADQKALLAQYTNTLSQMAPDDPGREQMMKLIEDQQIAINQAQYNVSIATEGLTTVSPPTLAELRATAFQDPASLVTKADVATFTPEQAEAGKIAETAGQVSATVTPAALTSASAAAGVEAPSVEGTATYDAMVATDAVRNTLSTLTAATGKPSAEALAEAATMTPQELASLGLTVSQIEEATQVVAPEARTVQEGELISGTTVDQARVEQALNFQAATGVPSTEATVQGQLTQLLSQFENGETPPWAAGAMRAATATLAARGLAASSMAGQAVVQAAMESALPIAQADAATRAQFEAQNLSNRQQVAMFAAQQRAAFLNLEFDQEFQTRVMNAAKIADIANMNFTAEQQIALENARLTQTVNLANLNYTNAKIMADAAAMTQVDVTNLNNRQQAAVQQASAFLQMDMANLTNQQQTSMFKSQSIVNALLSDQAAINAANQFNASSENQMTQFYDNLTAQIDMHNKEQENAMARFNAEQAQAMEQFNAARQDARDQFNATQELLIAQANAQWDQTIATTENAEQNQANRDAAQAATGMTEATYNNMLQQERDVMDYAWRTVDNALARDNSLTIAEMQAQAEVDKAKGSAIGGILGTITQFALSKI